MTQEVLRTLSPEDLEAVRKSVAGGVETVVKPFLGKVDAQSVLPERINKMRIGGPNCTKEHAQILGRACGFDDLPRLTEATPAEHDG